jgi:hypothetical protein
MQAQAPHPDLTAFSFVDAKGYLAIHPRQERQPKIQQPGGNLTGFTSQEGLSGANLCKALPAWNQVFLPERTAQPWYI